MSLLKNFKDHIAAGELFRTDQILIIAISGGVDSVVLADLCLQAGYIVELAHCNFRLRGEMSDGDESFVRSFADAHKVKLHVRSFDTSSYATQQKVSIQVAARELRYAWFEELIGTAGGVTKAVVLTAHHLDDNIETMLMNFFKGTGIAGLRGIRSRRNWLVRPLLFAGKEELMAYAASNNLQWRTDQSNEENKYTRNFFRNQLIPMIKTVYPEAEQNMAANQQRFIDVEVLYNEALTSRIKKLVHKKGEEIHIPVRKLMQSTAIQTITYELFREYGFPPSTVSGIISLCQSESGRYVRSATHRIIRNRNWLVLVADKPSLPGLYVAEGPALIETSDGLLNISIEAYKGQPADQGPSCILADARDLQFPMLIRKWKPGDYFYPLGMRKKKKIARFLIDQKISKTAKEKTWVIESAKKIVWVAGLRMDDRFRITPSTKEIIRFHWKAVE